MSTMDKRVCRLEAAREDAAAPSRKIILMSRHDGETDEQAKARWKVENPKEALPSDDNIIMLVGIKPAPRPNLEVVA